VPSAFPSECKQNTEHASSTRLGSMRRAQLAGELRPSSLILEVLKGNQRGRHNIRVNEQYRVTFRWEGNHAYEVRCKDYHS
jgi:proteic killer suppression protein